MSGERRLCISGSVGICPDFKQHLTIPFSCYEALLICRSQSAQKGDPSFPFHKLSQIWLRRHGPGEELRSYLRYPTTPPTIRHHCPLHLLFTKSRLRNIFISMDRGSATEKKKWHFPVGSVFCLNMAHSYLWSTDAQQRQANRGTASKLVLNCQDTRHGKTCKL